MELVVLVLDPVEFKKVDGQQDDAQEKHEADDQRHGKPSESHPAATPPQRGGRPETRKKNLKVCPLSTSGDRALRIGYIV